MAHTTHRRTGAKQQLTAAAAAALAHHGARLARGKKASSPSEVGELFNESDTLTVQPGRLA